MTTGKNLREELLKQNGGSTEKVDDLRDKVLAKEERQVARMKRLVIVAWALVVASFFAGAGVRPLFPGAVEARPLLESIATIIAIAWFWITVIFTVSLYIRSRTLTLHQIQTRLTVIEEQLKKMAGKE